MVAAGRRVWKSPRMFIAGEWSGIRESNPRLHLGKVAYYHYTNPANEEVSRLRFIYSTQRRIATSATTRVFSTPPRLTATAPGGRSQRRFACPVSFSRLLRCGRPLPPETSSGGRQTVPRVRDRYIRARIFHRRDSTPSLASGDASGDGRDASGIVFWLFSSWAASFSFSIFTALVSAGHAGFNFYL
jgi:hypothetical protein